MKCPDRVALFLAAAVGAAAAVGLAAAAGVGAPPQPAQQPPTLADGNYSAAGLYNLANSYARAGKPAMAVLNYQRAALLAPDDADIRANLKYVRTSLHLSEPAQSPLESIAHLASPSTVAWLGVLGMLLTATSLIAVKIVPRYRVLWIAATCSGFAAIAFTVCNAIYWGPKTHEAVVIAPSTPMRATPVPMGDSLQELSEAQTVTVLQGHEDFVLIRTPSGHSGWVARADLADVVPTDSVR